MTNRAECWMPQGHRDGWEAYSRYSHIWTRGGIGRDFQLLADYPLAIVPINDTVNHDKGFDCACQPATVVNRDGGVLLHHNAWDGRKHSLDHAKDPNGTD